MPENSRFAEVSVHSFKIIITCPTSWFILKQLRGEFFLLCNMRSKLIPTDHIYIHKYINVLSFDVSQPPHVLKKFVDCMSYTIMLK